MSIRDVARCVALCLVVSGSASGLTTYPARTTQGTQAARGAQCSASRLVGTWERVSLLRNALSVQPPDAPLFVKFGSDGYWSMMEMPDRPKVNKPLEQQTDKELWSRFEKVEGGYGTWSVKGDVVTRKHLVNIAPGGEGASQDRSCAFEGEILALVGTGANRSPQARFRRLPAQTLKSPTLVGTWERTSLTIDGKAAQPPAAPQFVILGEDGWFSQTQLPTGRKAAGKPMEQFTVDDYVKSYGGVGAARGTYTVEGTLLTRKHVADLDPMLSGSTDAAQFSLEGETMTLRGAMPSGARTEARFRRLKPQQMN
jgi:hypothetical protein